MKLTAFIDGSSYGNPGEAGYGVVFYNEAGDTVYTVGGYIGKSTNNVAEYQALIHCLREAKNMACVHLSVFSDSQLLVNQINGEYRVKQPHLQILYQQVMKEIADLGSAFQLSHVPREKNKEADSIARKAVKCQSRITDGQIFPHGENR